MPKSKFFRIEVWSTRFLGIAERATELLTLLDTMDSGRWTPQHWNTHEPIRKPYSADSHPEILVRWTQDEPQGSGNLYNDLLFRRKQPRMLIFAHAQRWGQPKLNYCWIILEVKPFLTVDGPDRLRGILKDFVAWSKACYGSVYYSGQAHHRVVQATPLERLEQAYWLNFFGEPYLNLFGRERILHTPCHLVEEIPNGLLLQATTRFDDSEMTESNQVLVNLEEYWGPEAFAGRGYPQIPCTVPDFDLSETSPNSVPVFSPITRVRN